jgi:hypothetical protein
LCCRLRGDALAYSLVQGLLQDLEGGGRLCGWGGSQLLGRRHVVILRWLLGQWLAWIILLERRGVDERRWGVDGLLWWWLWLLLLQLLMLMLENVLRWRSPL